MQIGQPDPGPSRLALGPSHERLVVVALNKFRCPQGFFSLGRLGELGELLGPDNALTAMLRPVTCVEHSNGPFLGSFPRRPHLS